jgi:hypothetical protein
VHARCRRLWLKRTGVRPVTTGRVPRHGAGYHPAVDDAPRPLRVPTERIEALIRTVDQLIVGRLHAQPGKRLKDEMNHESNRFIAVTDARVYDTSGQHLLYASSFLLLANDHIVSVAPRPSVTAGRVPWSDMTDGTP